MVILLMGTTIFGYMYLSSFFFSSRRRHTRCSRDWSSDVCSSDLVFPHQYAVLILDEKIVRRIGLSAQFCKHRSDVHIDVRIGIEEFPKPLEIVSEIGRASCRERV